MITTFPLKRTIAGALLSGGVGLTGLGLALGIIQAFTTPIGVPPNSTWVKVDNTQGSSATTEVAPGPVNVCAVAPICLLSR
jgi:hypothetical protein